MTVRQLFETLDKSYDVIINRVSYYNYDRIPDEYLDKEVRKVEPYSSASGIPGFIIRLKGGSTK